MGSTIAWWAPRCPRMGATMGCNPCGSLQEFGPGAGEFWPIVAVGVLRPPAILGPAAIGYHQVGEEEHCHRRG
jgi:hypothetical protein